MNLSLEAISHIIGAKRVVPITETDMIKELEIVFFPSVIEDKELIKFEMMLKRSFLSLGIKITKFEEIIDVQDNKRAKVKD